MKKIFIISIVMICAILSIGILFLMGRYVLKIRPWDGMGTKESMITHFKNNQDLFEEVVQDIKNGDYAQEIYGDWVSRNPDTKYSMYYKDTNSQCIMSMFENEEWYLDSIVYSSEESETRDCGIIFTQFEGGSYNYWGVYYVEDDELIGWSGLKRFKPTEKKGDGYLLEKDGCRYYTERICENWWYFQANY